MDHRELMSLADANIASINLNYTLSSLSVEGNSVAETSMATKVDGSNLNIGDAWFAVNSGDTQYQGATPNDRFSALPDLRSYGDLKPLHVAMAENPALAAAVSAFQAEVNTADLPTLEADFTNLIYTWAGVQDHSPTERGAYIDARTIEFLEAANGSNTNS